jgi:hypothetical protein
MAKFDDCACADTYFNNARRDERVYCAELLGVNEYDGAVRLRFYSQQREG